MVSDHSQCTGSVDLVALIVQVRGYNVTSHKMLFKMTGALFISLFCDRTSNGPTKQNV